MISRLVLMLLALVALATSAVPVAAAQKSIEWDGYGQFRYLNSRSVTTFSIRRAKLWIKGPVSFDDHMSMKVQGIFRSKVSGSFVLQDVYAQYQRGMFQVRGGQMVPEFTLEWSQPDATLPLVERASAVRLLVPAAPTLNRDIGAQATLQPEGGRWHASLGLFNGNGANHPVNSDKHFLTTARATYRFGSPTSAQLEVGASVAYRKTDALSADSILGDEGDFAGRDFRWGSEMRFSSAHWQVQGEYVQANLGGRQAWGYYAFAARDLGARNQAVASVEQLDLPRSDFATDPWYVLAFNHFFSQHKSKVMVDARLQPAEGRTNYLATVQYQLFFR